MELARLPLPESNQRSDWESSGTHFGEPPHTVEKGGSMTFLQSLPTGSASNPLQKTNVFAR
jgi:hypothetical protein